MSRSVKLRLLVTVGLALSPGAVEAQHTEQELVARLDSLRPLLDAATEELEAYVAEIEERERIEAATRSVQDTVHVGMMTSVSFLLSRFAMISLCRGRNSP